MDSLEKNLAKLDDLDAVMEAEMQPGIMTELTQLLDKINSGDPDKRVATLAFAATLLDAARQDALRSEQELKKG